MQKPQVSPGKPVVFYDRAGRAFKKRAVKGDPFIALYIISAQIPGKGNCFFCFSWQKQPIQRIWILHVSLYKP